MPKFASTLHFSKYFTGIQLILLVGSIICVVSLPFAGWIKSALLMGILAYSVWNFYSHRQWQGIGQDKKGWYLQKNGEKGYITVSGDTTITHVVTLLRFRYQGKRWKHSCALFRDSMPLDVYRQLIVRIKYFNRERDIHHGSLGK